MRHRRRKAAAKCHLRLNIGAFLPTFAVLEDAARHDSVRADVLCAGMGVGDGLLADRAYVDLDFLAGLEARDVFFVLRPKRKMLFQSVKSLPCKGKILRDELVHPAGVKTAQAYPHLLRLVTALVEVDGVQREMPFITNNTVWSARAIAELYRARWTIELFFKELKQALQLRDFVGINEKALKWQVWTGLLTRLLLRFLRHLSRWGRSFSRCVGVVRSALWVKTALGELLACYGTAPGPHRPILCAKEPFLPGLRRSPVRLWDSTDKLPLQTSTSKIPPRKFQHTHPNPRAPFMRNPQQRCGGDEPGCRPSLAYGMLVK